MTLRPGSAPRGPSFLLLLACLVTLGLGACGRRGQPEAPVDPAAPPTVAAPKRQAETGRRRGAAAADTGASESRSTSGNLVTSPNAATQLTPDDETDEEDPNAGVSPQPVPTTSRRRSRAYQVPKEPFFLDPLL